jgi:carbohydrate-selective porin OprB
MKGNMMQKRRDAATIASVVLAGILTAIIVSEHGAAADSGSQAKIDHLMEQLGNLELGLSATGIVQGTLNNDANNPDHGETQDATWSIDLEIGAPIAAHGQAFILIEAGQGEGLTNDPGVGESFFGINDDAGDSTAKLEVTEAWYEHQLWDERVIFTLGKLDLTNYFDTNAVANDETSQFLSSGLVNSLAIAFPEDNGAGVRLTAMPAPWLALSVGWGEHDADFEDVFDHGFLIGEVDFTLSIGQHPGAYRFYLWYNLADFPSFDDPDDTDHNWGAGMSFDQQLLEPISIFLRLAFQQDDVSEVGFVWSSGVQILGTWWTRPQDVVAIAIGQAVLSEDFEDSTEAPARTGDEWFVEAYYRAVWNEHLALSLHLQVIDNAGGNKDVDTITVVGGRAQLTF